MSGTNHDESERISGTPMSRGLEQMVTVQCWRVGCPACGAQRRRPCHGSGDVVHRTHKARLAVRPDDETAREDRMRDEEGVPVDPERALVAVVGDIEAELKRDVEVEFLRYERKRLMAESAFWKGQAAAMGNKMIETRTRNGEPDEVWLAESTEGTDDEGDE